MSEQHGKQTSGTGLSINGHWYRFGDTDPSTPLLWFLREQCGLTGSKYGCGIGSCGACTVLLEQRDNQAGRFQAIRACVMPLSALIADGSPPARVLTIEGLAQRHQRGMTASQRQQTRPPSAATDGDDIDELCGTGNHADGETACPHPVQNAWIEQQVPQCGYCQSGQILSAVALLEALATDGGTINDRKINQAMAGNLCRCGTYPRIRKAIKQAAAEMNIEVSA